MSIVPSKKPLSCWVTRKAMNWVSQDKKFSTIVKTMVTKFLIFIENMLEWRGGKCEPRVNHGDSTVGWWGLNDTPPLWGGIDDPKAETIYNKPGQHGWERSCRRACRGPRNRGDNLQKWGSDAREQPIFRRKRCGQSRELRDVTIVRRRQRWR